MTKIFNLFILFLFSISINAQIQIDTCTEAFHFSPFTTSPPLIILDTISNPNNIWEIGIPDKADIPIPFTPNTSMVTDSMNAYPNNDTSSFIIPICHFFGTLYPGTTGTEFELKYYMDSDTITDFGKIEVSIDNGNTWWNIESEGWVFNWSLPDLIFSGNSGGLRTIRFDPMGGEGSSEFYSHFESENSMTPNEGVPMMLVRFTFISDETQGNKYGWVIENITMTQYIFSSVENLSKDFFKTKVSPNPASQIIFLEIENNISDDYYLQLFSTSGQVVYQSTFQNENKIPIDVSSFPNGIYHFSILNKDTMQKSFGKIVVAH